MGFFSLFGVMSPAHMAVTRVLTGARYIGVDTLGNRYYAAKPRKGYRHDRRFVMYAGRPEASSVPPEWHGWLHHQTDAVPDDKGSSFRKSWQKPAQANLTGTTDAYRPPGHILNQGQRPPATGDYEPWTPAQ